MENTNRQPWIETQVTAPVPVVQMPPTPNLTAHYGPNYQPQPYPPEQKHKGRGWKIAAYVLGFAALAAGVTAETVGPHLWSEYYDEPRHHYVDSEVRAGAPAQVEGSHVYHKSIPWVFMHEENRYWLYVEQCPKDVANAVSREQTGTPAMLTSSFDIDPTKEGPDCTADWVHVSPDVYRRHTQQGADRTVVLDGPVAGAKLNK